MLHAAVRAYSAPMRKVILFWFNILFLVVVVGCADKAKPDYDKCLAAESARDRSGAWKACSAAVGTDPESASGKEASKKLDTLWTALSNERDQLTTDLASTTAKLAATMTTRASISTPACTSPRAMTWGARDCAATVSGRRCRSSVCGVCETAASRFA